MCLSMPWIMTKPFPLPSTKSMLFVQLAHDANGRRRGCVARFLQQKSKTFFGNAALEFSSHSSLSPYCGDPGSPLKFQWPRFCASCKCPVFTTWNLSVVSNSTHQAGSCFEALIAAHTRNTNGATSFVRFPANSVVLEKSFFCNTLGVEASAFIMEHTCENDMMESTHVTSARRILNMIERFVSLQQSCNQAANTNTTDRKRMPIN